MSCVEGLLRVHRAGEIFRNRVAPISITRRQRRNGKRAGLRTEFQAPSEFRTNNKYRDRGEGGRRKIKAAGKIETQMRERDTRKENSANVCSWRLDPSIRSKGGVKTRYLQEFLTEFELDVADTVDFWKIERSPTRKYDVRCNVNYGRYFKRI